MLIAAFAAGLAVPAASAESHHGRMVVAMSADHQGGCGHDGCPTGQPGDVHGACSQAGPGASVLSSTPAMVHLAAVQDVLPPSLDLPMADRAPSPDPHPPKHTG